MPEEKNIQDEKSRDPVTEEPVSHLVGAGAGAVGGGAAGAAIGTAVGGPVGTVIGAVVGAVAGAYGGKAIAESVDPEAEDAHWRQNYQSEPYVQKDRPYEDYQPAYRTGYEGFEKYEPGTRFEEAEPTLQEDYRLHAGALSGTTEGAMEGATAGTMEGTTTQQPRVPWEEARPAAQAAWNRVEKGEAIRVPLTEEQINVRKREVEGGGVRLRKVVKTEVVNQPVELKHEEFVVERVATTGEGTVSPDAFKEGEVFMPLKKEEAVVEKTAVQAGEVHVKKVEKTGTEQIHEQVRREDVEVENDDRRRQT